MTVIRLILLVAVLGGLTLLLAQNWLPAIPLVFLGLRSQPVALAIWMLFATAAGVFTSLLISGLLQLSSRYVKPERTSYSPSDSPRVDKRTPRENVFTERKTTPPPVNKVQIPLEYENTEDDDWDLDKNASDDWEFDRRLEEREYTAADSRQYTKIQDDRDYEFREPENDYKSADSSYSYDKTELKNSGVGKTESVYDADYRVIVPPSNPSTTSNTSDNSEIKENDDDDWGFFEEDFDGDDKPSPR
ncbi:MAG: LapA family protein [Rivularia sp. (in: cyanobacteria)]